MPPRGGDHREKQRPGHPELLVLFSGAWGAGGLQEETKQSQGGVEQWRDTRLVLPPGFSMDIGRGWGDQIRENKLEP